MSDNLEQRKYKEDVEVEVTAHVKVEINEQEIDAEADIFIDRTDYFEHFKGIENIYWDASNLFDQQLMELFAQLVTKHGPKRMLDWLGHVKAKHGV